MTVHASPSGCFCDHAFEPNAMQKWRPILVRCLICAVAGTILLICAAIVISIRRTRRNTIELDPASLQWWLEPLSTLVLGFSGILLCLIALQRLIRMLCDCCRDIMPPLGEFSDDLVD